ncbi:MAG TPA: chemotaxis protein CheB [Opitutaceae bacterium]
MDESDLTDRTPSTPSGDPADISAPVDLVSRAKLAFPVVGIGASAGGIEALRKFFAATSATSGMAFVVIQHLSPDHDSLMVEILARCAPMPVHQIEDGVRVEPNHAYVIRPGHTVTLEDGRLRLGEPVEKRGHRRPVDDFFRSLAREQQDKSIAVVLSGMGTNGTAGAQAIKAVGGLCIAQDPDKAEFPAMPRSLIHAGYADQVLAAEEIPDLLLRFVQHPYLDLDPKGHARAARELERHRQQLSEIIALVRARTGHDFAPYKPPTVLRRIQRRMGLVGAPELDVYATHLKQHMAEAEALANDLMINVTGFFRDPEAWEALREAVVRPMVEARAADDPIRAWVTACASGEEAYSLAMLIAEETARARKKLDVKIFATDTADKSLALARAGVFPGGIESDFAPERLERFFEKDEHTYRIRKELRDQVVFAPQDVLRDPPFSRVDLVTCRNLLIYLEVEAQRRALTLLHFALRDGGYLFLGNAETLGQADERFEVVSKRWRIYRRTGPTQHRFADLTTLRAPELRTVPGLPAPVTITRPSSTVAIQAALLEQFGPPTAVVDANERIVYFHGDAEPYLMHPSGETTQGLLEMVRPHLRPAVRSALRQAATEKRAITIEQSAPAEGGGVIRVTAQPLRPSRTPEHFRVSFEQPTAQEAAPIPAPHRLRSGGDEALEEEARALRRELQTSVEAFEATNEELKASNEEVISINEELQSTNEELETGKEELQSLNEELTTANAQLQGKMEELETTTNDLTSLLRSTDIAVVFLDPSLKIRRFTPSARDLVEILQTDIGRPISDLARKFEDPDFLADGAAVIQTGRTVEKEVDTRSGRTFVRRILPYKTTENKVDGVVIVFVEISDRKAAEAELRRSEQLYRIVMDGLTEHAIVVLDTQGRFKTWPASAERFFGYGAADILGKPLATIYGGGPERGQAAGDKLALALKSGTVSDEHWYRRANGSMFWGSGAISPLWDPKGQLIGFVKVVHDYTERKRAEDALKKARDAAEEANTAKDEFLANVSHELRTPLSSILLWTSVIEDKSAQAAPKLMDEGINAIKRSAEEQKDLIEDLIDSARIESGKMELDIERTAMAPLVDSAVQTIRPSASAKGVQIHLKQDPELGDVMADPTRCHQVIWNLVGNAVKFTPDGGTVSIRTAREGDTVVIEVKDTGAGIDGAFLPHVFSRFGQASRGTRRSTSGLGLGLSIARTLVELHRGTIAAESQGAGRGATFTVRLPLPRLQPRATPSPRPPAALAGKLAGRRILLVENDANLRRGLTVVLEAAQMTVDAVDSAASALETINRARPDFIVSDIGLSTMDGYDFIKAVRAAERKRGEKPVPALALTAFAGDQHRVRALESGYQDWMAKPVEPGRILEAVERLGEG